MDVDFRALLIVVVFIAVYFAIPLGVVALYITRVRRKRPDRVRASEGMESRHAGR